LVKFYKGLVFSVFNIKIIEYSENDKYSTKNNKSEEVKVFLATKNHISASTISISILMETATIRCIVWLAGSFFNPLLKIYRDKRTMAEKLSVNMTISLKRRATSVKLTSRYPAGRRIRSRSRSPIVYFLKITGKNDHLIKSLIAV
jgi:hypothetical protein